MRPTRDNATKPKRSAAHAHPSMVMRVAPALLNSSHLAFVNTDGIVVAVLEDPAGNNTQVQKKSSHRRALRDNTETWQAVKVQVVGIVGAGYVDNNFTNLLSTTQVYIRSKTEDTLRFFGEKRIFERPDKSVLQLLRQAELRDTLIEEYPTISAKQVAEITHSKASNASQSANRLKKRSAIFSVMHHEGMECYPAFQFNPNTGVPKPIISELIKIFDLKKHDPWELFIWLTTPTGLLGGTKPVDKLDMDQQAVVEAARRERAEPYF